MRLLLVLTLSAGAARAEPPASAEVVPEQPALPAPGATGTGARGVDDVWATGIVVAPPAHGDAAAWPNGMVMTPQDPLDDNVLVPGSVRLADRGRRPLLPPVRTWPAHAARGLAYGVRGLLDLMTPPTL